MHRKIAIAALVMCCILMAGCADILSVSQNVEELLRAPRPDAKQNAVQTALNEYLGEALQLKYPRGGREPDPIVFADLDGDGSEEAAVLYTTESKGKNVHLAILEQENGTWEIGYEVRGLSTDVAQLETVRLLDDSVQLIVGYTGGNSSDKFLEVYDYRDVTLYSVCRQPYDTYFAGDVKNNGRTALAVTYAAGEPGALTLRVLEPSGRALAQTGEAELDSRFEKSVSIQPTHSGRKRGLVVDGLTSDGMSASQLLEWQEDGSLAVCPQGEEKASQAFMRSRRLSSLEVLSPADLENEGRILIPEVGASIPTLQSTKRFYPVEWTDYLSAVSLQQYGIYDAQYDYFLRLPKTWKDKITLSVQGDAYWQIRSAADNGMLCSVRILPLNALNGMYIEVARIGDKKVLVSFGENCTPSESNLIRRGVLTMEE